jgi:predicted NAD/FAD-binding protein
MRIAIIGGGTAGLAAAWLLEPDNDVVLFERQNRLGGHADTVTVEVDGAHVPIDAGFGFFSEKMFPTFTRLLGLLKVPIKSYPLTTTYYTTDHRRVILLPPVPDGEIVWAGLRPRNLTDLLQFLRVLTKARPLMAARDTATTIADFVEGLAVTKAFKEEFLYPFLLAGWCVEPDEFRGFIAYNVLRYAYLHQPTGLAASNWLEIPGGMQDYIRTLADSLERTNVRMETEIVSAEKNGSAFLLIDSVGNRFPADHVVFAGNAYEMAKVLERSQPDAPALVPLKSYEYIRTKIAIHGDRGLMPADERLWSVVNIRYNGHHASNSVWRGNGGSRQPVFKSWVTFDEQLPEPLYALRTYWHPKINTRYFESQAALRRYQGRDNLWFAGVHTHDVDCHESAIVSAVKIAQRLAPETSRLKRLTAPL